MKRIYTEYTHPTLPTERILNTKGVTITRDKKLRDLGYTRTMRIEISEEFCNFLKKTLDK